MALCSECQVLQKFTAVVFRYKNSEECRVKNEMSTASLKKAVETAEKQLQQLTCGKFDVSFERLQYVVCIVKSKISMRWKTASASLGGLVWSDFRKESIFQKIKSKIYLPNV